MGRLEPRRDGWKCPTPRATLVAACLLALVGTPAAADDDRPPLRAATSVPVGAEIKNAGRYYDAPAISKIHAPLRFLRFNYKNLEHRAPWVVFHVMLDRTVDLNKGELRLIFGQVSEQLTVKIEARDARYSRAYSAGIRYILQGGEDQVIRLRGGQPLDGFHPFGWQRLVQWPRWDSIQFVGLTIEARYVDSPSGSIRLDQIIYVPDHGRPVNLRLWSNRIFCYEHTPARGYVERKRKASAKPTPRAPTPEPATERIAAGEVHEPPGALIAEHEVPVDELHHAPPPPPEEPPHPASILRSEATLDVKRDDPSTVLFVSGAGYKLGLDPLDALGINAQGNLREERHRTDSLLINHVRKEYLERKFLDAPHHPRQFLDEPVVVWSALGSIIFDIPETDFPRFRFTYEDVDLDSNSTIALDARQQVHEAAMLWNSQYFSDKRRYRLTLEPAYQYWKITTTSDDTFIPLDRHRGVLNAVFHDDWEQREFFGLAIYGRSNHKDVDTDETEQEYRFEWRQWYGEEILAFSTVGFTFTQTEFDVAQNPSPRDDLTFLPIPLNGARRKDYLREYRIFGNYITELSDDGRWRWFTEAGYRRTDVDTLLSFNSNTVTNLKIDFFEVDSRVIFEALPDLDVSLGVSHDFVLYLDQSAASDVINASNDRHLFDSISVEGRVSLFNFGNSRVEFRAQQTFYYHLGDELTTVYLQYNFAR